MNNFQYDDLQGRNKFKQDFNKYYIIKDTSEFDITDVQMTACTNSTNNSATSITYEVEIKKRNYNIDVLSASTMIEATKLNYFRQLHKEEPNKCLIYFNYYNDGWIAFDITNRLNYGVNLDRKGQKLLPNHTSICSDMVMKDINYLSYTNNIYVKDKMCVYSSY